MNERFRLNSELFRNWMTQLGVKHSYVSRKLGCSDSYVDKMLGGRVPAEKMLKKLADLVGVEVAKLLLPREDRKAG